MPFELTWREIMQDNYLLCSEILPAIEIQISLEASLRDFPNLCLLLIFKQTRDAIHFLLFIEIMTLHDTRCLTYIRFEVNSEIHTKELVVKRTVQHVFVTGQSDGCVTRLTMKNFQK